MILRTLPAVASVLLCACTSRPTPPPIPPGTQALLGADLDRLGEMSSVIRTRLGTPEGARHLLLALTPAGLIPLPETSALPAPAQILAKSAPLWAVVQGDATLPLSGNLANLNRFLHSTEYTTLAVQPGEKYSIEITGICRTAAIALPLEQTLRGFVSLAAAAKGANATGIEIQSENQLVRVKLAADRATLEALLR